MWNQLWLPQNSLFIRKLLIMIKCYSKLLIFPSAMSLVGFSTHQFVQLQYLPDTLLLHSAFLYIALVNKVRVGVTKIVIKHLQKQPLTYSWSTYFILHIYLKYLYFTYLFHIYFTYIVQKQSPHIFLIPRCQKCNTLPLSHISANVSLLHLGRS